MEKEFYSTKEFCELIGISRSTLWRMMKAGSIQVLKIGNAKNSKVIIPASEVERLKYTPQNLIEDTEE